jgi:hypothetical protein
VDAQRIVFVHGIGPPGWPEAEREQWAAAMSVGARQAGHTRVAKALSDTSGPVDVVYAHYRDLFDPPQTQGTEALDLNPDAAEMLQAMLAEMLENCAQRPLSSDQAATLQRAKFKLEPVGAEQGAGDLVRRVIDAATTLMGLGPVRHAGQWVTGKLMVRDLAQVARYLSRAEPDGSGVSLDKRIRARVLAALGSAPSVVVAHSLGSVVALETLHEHSGKVPLLVTLGSPIGLRTVVWPRLMPQPPRTPQCVARWLNVWDRDDIIAVRPVLDHDVLPNAESVRPHSVRVDSDGLWVHSATKYLAQAAVAGPVAEIVDRYV